MSRKDGQPASSSQSNWIFFRTQSFALGGSVQFDEYWLETNMTKLHADPGATVSYEVTVYSAIGVRRQQIYWSDPVDIMDIVSVRKLSTLQVSALIKVLTKRLVSIYANIKALALVLVFSWSSLTKLRARSAALSQQLLSHPSLCQLMVSIRQKLTNSLSKLLIIFSLSKFLSLIFSRPQPLITGNPSRK